MDEKSIQVLREADDASMLAIILEDQRKRQELLDEENAEAKAEAAYLQARSDAEQAAKAAQAKAKAKYQAALYGQYEAQQQELDAGATLAATRNTLPSDVIATMSGKLPNDTDIDDTKTNDTETSVDQAFREADENSMVENQQNQTQIGTAHQSDDLLNNTNQTTENHKIGQMVAGALLIILTDLFVGLPLAAVAILTVGGTPPAIAAEVLEVGHRSSREITAARSG
jgi:hypothetical protein